MNRSDHKLQQPNQNQETIETQPRVKEDDLLVYRNNPSENGHPRSSAKSTATDNELLNKLFMAHTLADKMISEEEDYLGALQAVHPQIYEYVMTNLKKAQRRIETLELKQFVKSDGKALSKSDEPADERIRQLERVNQEMKKSIKCYKEELESIKKVDEQYKQFESYQKLVTDYNNLYDHYKVKKLANLRLKDEL